MWSHGGGGGGGGGAYLNERNEAKFLMVLQAKSKGGRGPLDPSLCLLTTVASYFSHCCSHALWELY